MLDMLAAPEYRVQDWVLGYWPYFSALGNAGTALKWLGRTYLREQNEAEPHKM